MARAAIVSQPPLALKRASTHEVTMRLAAFDHLAAVSIERVVDDPCRSIVFMVVLETEMTKTFRNGFKAWSLRLMVQRVVGIGAVDDPPQQHQRGIAGEVVFFQ